MFVDAWRYHWKDILRGSTQGVRQYPTGDFWADVSGVDAGIEAIIATSEGDYTDAAIAGSGVFLGKLKGANGIVNVTGRPRTVEQALTSAERFLGQGYKEIAPGVFRSANGTRRFRMTTSDLNGRGMRGQPHVHFERDGVRWIVLECDPRDTGGVFLYLHETLDGEAVFDEWYENMTQAKSSAEDLWGVPEASWNVVSE